MLAEDSLHVPVWASLAVITFLVGGSVALSVLRKKHPDGTPRPPRGFKWLG